MDLNFGFLSDLGVYQELAVALGIFIVFLLFSVLTRGMFKIYTKKFSVLTNTTLDDEILGAVRRPICLGIILLGLYLGLNSLTVFQAYSVEMLQAIRVVAILLLSYAVASVVEGVVRWYLKEVAIKTKSRFDDKYMPVFRKIITIAIYAIAGLLILGEFGIEITPLIASLGIGGLAVALALQDTLANFFAGAYIVADKPLKPGDYISFDGHEGYVEEIGWRSTRIKNLPGNFIVVPNSKLAQSIITNYYGPKKEMSVPLQVGVSYDSDLEKVEKITIEVARKILQETPGGVKDFEPLVRYNKFDDSSINFSVVLRVEKFVDKFLVTHEFIKALKKRYDQEGIEIPFPIRTVYMKEERQKAKKT